MIVVGKVRDPSRVNHAFLRVDVIDWLTGTSVCSESIRTDLIQSPYPVVGLQRNGNPIICGLSLNDKACMVVNDDKELVEARDLAHAEQLISGVQVRPGMFVVTGGANSSNHDRDTIQLIEV